MKLTIFEIDRYKTLREREVTKGLTDDQKAELEALVRKSQVTIIEERKVN